MKYTIGVISDTHGLLRTEAIAALQKVDFLLHAGDIGNPQILDQLRAIAPLEAVLGNTDVPYYYPRLSKTKTIEIRGKRIHLIHNIATLRADVVQENIDLVVYGHSHRPTLDDRDGVMYFNPGSAGPPRFGLPVTLGFLIINGENIEARHEYLGGEPEKNASKQ